MPLQEPLINTINNNNYTSNNYITTQFRENITENLKNNNRPVEYNNMNTNNNSNNVPVNRSVYSYTYKF